VLAPAVAGELGRRPRRAVAEVRLLQLGAAVGTAQRLVSLLGGVLPVLVDAAASRRNVFLGQIEPDAEGYFTSVNFHPPAWRCALETLGADRIVYGSDYPLPIGSMERGIALIDALDITPRQREMIYSGTAVRLLR